MPQKIGTKNTLILCGVAVFFVGILFFVNHDFLDREKFVVVPVKVVSADYTDSAVTPRFKIQYTYNDVTYTKDAAYYQVGTSYTQGRSGTHYRFPALNDTILFSIYKNDPGKPHEVYTERPWWVNIIIVFAGVGALWLVRKNIKDPKGN